MKTEYRVEFTTTDFLNNGNCEANLNIEEYGLNWRRPSQK